MKPRGTAYAQAVNLNAGGVPELTSVAREAEREVKRGGVTLIATGVKRPAPSATEQPPAVVPPTTARKRASSR
jgi:hypothetical protein